MGEKMIYVNIVTSAPLFTVQKGQRIEISKLQFRNIFGLKENELPNFHSHYKWRDFLFKVCGHTDSNGYRLVRIE